MSDKDETLEFGAPSVVVDNISVVYKTPTNDARARRNSTLGQKFSQRVLGKQATVDVQAVKPTSFVARNGEFIGMLGANGAGKSTILRVIAGVETPESGRVYATSPPVLMGVSGAMLGQLSGLENARLGCLAKGMSESETAAALPGIIEFADIGDAIYRPMNTYSSGMRARLTFAVSTAGIPKILIIDEALSTGDATFAEKSEERMNSMLEKAGTIFLVSHSLATIQRLCNRVIWMHDGEVIHDGPVDEVTELYSRWASLHKHRRDERAQNIIKDQKAIFVPQKINMEGNPSPLSQLS